MAEVIQKNKRKSLLELLQSGDIPGAKEELDEQLTEKIVEPAAEAGYPNLGAGAATGVSTIVDYLTPETPGEAAAAAMGGPLLSRVAKAGRLAKQAGKLDELESVIKSANKEKIINYLDEIEGTIFEPKWKEAGQASVQQLSKDKKLRKARGVPE